MAQRVREAVPVIPPDHPAAVALDRGDLDAARKLIDGCRACDLWAHATQGVFGEGAAPARLMLVGEQPGDREDIEGQPFVGPAGALLDRALRDAGIERNDVYITNAVKHFRFRARGKRRIHQRPDREHVQACRPWLDAELEVVKPDVRVGRGARTRTWNQRDISPPL